MAKATNIIFTIQAGKMDGHEINWKVIDEAENCADALQKFHSVSDYPFVEFHIETMWDDGTRTRNEVFNPTSEEVLVNGIWQRKQ